MAFFKEELLNVKAFIFDVDGVLSSDMSPLDERGEPMRTANVKDGFAIRNALVAGYPMAIISGATNENIRKRHTKLGVPYIYLGIHNKMECLDELLKLMNVKPEEILYMGDDIPDLEVMLKVGIPTCPSDAVTEVKAASKYISDRAGGKGCVRDVIEQVMRAQGKWNNPVALNTPSI